MSVFNYKRPSQDPKKSLHGILKEGLAIQLGDDAFLLIDFDRDDRRPLATVKIGTKFLSPQDFLYETESSNPE